MTDNGGQEPSAPEPAERGRYAIYETPDGGLLINRTVNLCEDCLNHGCGESADPVGPIPGSLVAMARAAAAGKMKLPAAMKQMMSRGR